jgi:hypothetical protein
MTIDFNIHALTAYLKENDLVPEFQKETGQIFIVYKIQEHEVPVFLLLRPESALLQMVAYLPYRLRKKILGEVARLLHILNKELDMPGFGMDEFEELMFYRAVLPCPQGNIDTRLFNMYLGTTRVACDTFMHAIGMVVSGTMRVDEVMKTPGPNA